MNWRFIIKWVAAFTLATFVYTVLPARFSLWGRFFMSAGILILLALAVGYVKDWIEEHKARKEQ